MAKWARVWPPWWNWEIDLWTHLGERMEDRGFTEVDLRRMMEYANGYRRARREGRWIITTTHRGEGWEIIVQPEPDMETLGVVTAYEVSRGDK